MAKNNYNLTTLQLFTLLDGTLNKFIAEIQKAKLSSKIYDIWNIRDILVHVTFWHTNYAANLSALEKKLKPPLLKGNYKEINLQAAQIYKNLTESQLIEQLRTAHDQIRQIVIRGRVRKMTYKHGSRQYSLKELLNMTEAHIRGHSKDVHHANLHA